MAGSSSIQGDQTVTFTDNMSFDGTDRGGAMNANGQLFIGSASSNRANNGGHVRLGTLASANGSVTVTNGPGTIDLAVATQNFAPNARLQEFDDFLGSNGNNRGTSKLSWNGGNFNLDDGTPDHPGIYKSSAGQSFSGLSLSDQNGGIRYAPYVMGGGVTSQSWIIQLPILSTNTDSYNYYTGFQDANSLGVISEAFQDALFFKYNHALNGGQWTINSTKAGVTTTVNTASLVTTAWTTLTIVVNANNTSASFYVNNVLVGTAITTNLPVVPLGPFVEIFNQAGSTPVTFVDLYFIDIALTNPRPGPSPSSGSTSGIFIGNYVNTAVSYQVLGTDAIIGVTDTSAPRTITMPALPGSIAQIWTIKDESLAASGNAITIDGNGNNIDGAATFPINTNGGSVDIYWSGTAFFII